jgi:hypothetical protein
MEIVNRRWNGQDDDQMIIQENGLFGCAKEGLARHQQFDRFISVISGQLFVKVIVYRDKPFKHMKKGSFRVNCCSLYIPHS